MVRETEGVEDFERNNIVAKQYSLYPYSEPFKIYVGSIHFSFTEENIKQIFEPFGAIESVNLHRDVLGKSKGYCFIQ